MFHLNMSRIHHLLESISPTFCSFFVQKFCTQLFCTYILSLYFFGARVVAQKVLIKCWWNWHLKGRSLDLEGPCSKISCQCQKCILDHILLIVFWCPFLNYHYKIYIHPQKLCLLQYHCLDSLMSSVSREVVYCRWLWVQEN